MSCAEHEKIHKGDWGTRLQVQITECINDVTAPVNVGPATTLKIRLEKPSGEILDRVATIVNSPGTDGWIEYVVQSGDLDEVGRWLIQGYVVFASGAWHAATDSFEVYENITGETIHGGVGQSDGVSTAQAAGIVV